MFGEVAQEYCKTEYRNMAGHVFSKKCEKVNSHPLVTKEELGYVREKMTTEVMQLNKKHQNWNYQPDGDELEDAEELY
jgi:hypothetical protein